MNTSFIFISSIFLSLLSVSLYNISTFQKSKHKIVGMHIGCNICDLLMYLITGGKSGVANSIVNLCKNTVYSKFNNYKLTILFSCLRIILLILSYEGILTLLFIFFEIIITIILLKGTAQQLRYMHLCSQIVWVFYDYTFANIFVACITATSCISLIAAIIKNNKHKLKNKDEDEKQNG